MALDAPPARWVEFVNRNWLTFSVAALAVYVATARFGLMIHPVSSFATLIWPPTGIAILLLLVGGYEFWPVVALGAFVTNYSIGAPLFVAFGIALGNTLEAYVGAYLLKEYVKVDWSFSHLRDTIGMVLVALAATLISATLGEAALLLGGTVTPATVGGAWFAWWVGDILGALVIVPLGLVWLAKPIRWPKLLELLEWAAMGALLVFTCFIVFWTPDFPDVYPLAIPLVWASLRTGPRGVTLSVLVLAFLGIAGTLAGHGVFGSPPLLRGIFLLQFAVAVAESLFLLFSSLMAERHAAIAALEGHVGTLKEALDKRRSDDKAKNEFLAILAHELRNPLAPILSTFEYLKITETEPERIQMVTGAEKQAHIMRRLLDDLLDVARVTQRKFRLKKQTIDLREVLGQAVETVGALIQAQRHTLTVSLPDDTLWVSVDPARMTQIFVNILSNAAKYTNPGGEIELHAEREGAETIVRIQDNGVGISSQNLKHIFEPFVSVHPTAEMSTGLGIGLSLTRRLLEMHGGTITAESEGLGTGSTFIVRIPLSAHVPLVVPEAKRESHERSTRTRRSLEILIVDDNDVAAKGLAKLLEHEGHTILLAYTGAEAIERARTRSPRVMLIDIGLPDVSGYDVAREVRKQNNAPKVLIALTGYGQESDKRKARLAGFDHHLTKPVGIKDLSELLDLV